MLCLICSNVFSAKRDCCPTCGALRVGNNKHVDWHHARKYELVNVSGESLVAAHFSLVQGLGRIDARMVDCED